jgi:hypothetical protein
MLQIQVSLRCAGIRALEPESDQGMATLMAARCRARCALHRA